MGSPVMTPTLPPRMTFWEKVGLAIGTLIIFTVLAVPMLIFVAAIAWRWWAFIGCAFFYGGHC